ncbi:hypothetical protein C6503_14985 [Candidatus Poribacteria bacterium]|nr:MAG: hypothetical protein C6503_14985 [Candidatus Poribacteria bacterium]
MSQTEKDIDQQTNLKMEKAIRSQMETLIPEMQKMADNYNIAGDKSPYRNVLNVAVDPASDVEVTKNFILYQLGRDQRSPWRNTDNEGEKLGLALVDAIKKLDNNAKLVVKNIGRNPETDKELVQQAHRRLMQLYLGNLVRYQVYLTFKAS